MIGMDRRTGKPLAGIGHLVQSVEDILTTRRGSRRMLPEYGSDLWRYVDLPVTGGWKSAVAAEAIRALRMWEPRLEVERIVAVSVLSGKITLRITGRYLGDNVEFEAVA